MGMEHYPVESNPNNDFLLSPINARLVEIAAALISPPPGHVDWIRLGPGSSEERRYIGDTRCTFC